MAANFDNARPKLNDIIAIQTINNPILMVQAVSPAAIPTSTILAITNGIKSSKITSKAAQATPKNKYFLYFFI